jgi:chaperone BCS1
MVDDFVPKKKDDALELFHLDMDGDWNKYSTVNKRSMDTVAVPSELKSTLKDQIEHFKDNRQWFYDRGLPYKLAYLIHGQPGGGKTSLIKSIASEFNMNICVININQVSDKSLEKGLANVPNNSVVIIEDFDSSGASKDRVQVNTESDDLKSIMSSLTLTGLLNTLDGINPLDDCVIFMTTNHLDKVDSAIYRKGRIDHIIEIKEVSPIDVAEYSSKMYPEHDFIGVRFNSVIGCKLNEALLYGKDNPVKYIESLRENGGVK